MTERQWLLTTGTGAQAWRDETGDLYVERNWPGEPSRLVVERSDHWAHWDWP